MKYDVFISYNSNDRDLIKLFTQELKNIGIRVFIDIWNLSPGEPWQEEIEKNMLNSKYIVIFIGKYGLGPWQNLEMRLALDLKIKYGLKVIPVLFPEAEVEKIPLFLTQLTWIDFRKGLDNNEQYNRLISTLGINEIENFKDNIFYKNKKIIKQTLILPTKNDLININIENILVHLILIIYFSTYVIYSFFLSKEEPFMGFLIVFVTLSIVSYRVIELSKKRNEVFSNFIKICDLSGVLVYKKNIFNYLDYIDCKTCKVKTPSILIVSVKNTIQRSIGLLLKIVPVIVTYTTFFPLMEEHINFVTSFLLLLYFSHSIYNTMNITMKILSGLGSIFSFAFIAIVLFFVDKEYNLLGNMSILLGDIYIGGRHIVNYIPAVILVIILIVFQPSLEIRKNFKCSVCDSINEKK